MKQLLAAITLVSGYSTAHAQDRSADANNPLASATALNFQDLCIGEIDGDGQPEWSVFAGFNFQF